MATLETEERLDEIAQLLAMLCRRLGPEEESLQDFVSELDSLGIGAGRIAKLAGTTPNYVSVALNRAKRKKG